MGQWHKRSEFPPAVIDLNPIGHVTECLCWRLVSVPVSKPAPDLDAGVFGQIPIIRAGLGHSLGPSRSDENSVLKPRVLIILCHSISPSLERILFAPIFMQCRHRRVILFL
jgi:hypothetical protein